MEVKDIRALVAAVRAMEPSSDVVSFARKLGDGVLCVGAQTFFFRSASMMRLGWFLARNLLKLTHLLEWLRRRSRDIHQVGCISGGYRSNSYWLQKKMEASDIAPGSTKASHTGCLPKQELT